MKKYKEIKTYKEINEKIKEGKAVVVTAEDLLGVVERDGKVEAPRKVDVVTTGTFTIPSLPPHVVEGSAGMDIFAAIKDEEIVFPDESKVIPAGIAIALPEGYEAQVRPQNGPGMGEDITLINFPGTIDADYREEIGVTMINDGERPFVVMRGNPIGQMSIHRVCAGMDIFAAIKSEEQILPGERKIIPTGITIVLPEGYKAQIRPPGGRVTRKRVTLIIFSGPIDADYREEIGVTMINGGKRPFVVKKGDHIARMVVYREGAG